MKHPVGRHLLVDMHGCNPDLLKRVDFISETIHEAAKRSKATIVGKMFKQFEPWAVSGVIVIAESHISIHTWPELGLASVDYYSCSEMQNMDAAVSYLASTLRATKIQVVALDRGNLRVTDSYETTIKEELINEMVV